MANSSQIVLAQMAAFIDGEGTIVISTPKVGYLSLRLQIANTDPRLMLWLRDNFGGSFSSVRPSGPRCKPSFIWNTSCKKAQTILQNCLPYFILKRQQAEVALAFQATFRMGRNQQQPLSNEICTQRADFKMQLRELNRRGVPVAA